MPPRLARLLAVVAAVALVVGAFVLRGVISGDDDGIDGPGVPLVRWKVVCDADLGEACERLESFPGIEEVKVLAAGEVLGPGEGSDPLAGFDLWITLDPIADVVGGDATTPAGDSKPVASASLAVVLRPEGGCDDPAPWDCLLAAGRNPFGLPDLDSSTGIVTAGAALIGLAGSDAPSRRDVNEHSGTLAEAEFDDLDGLTDDIYLPGRLSGIATPAAIANAVVGTSRGGSEGLGAFDIVDSPTIGVVVTPLRDEPDVVGGAEEVAAEILGRDGEQNVLDALAEAGFADGPQRSSGLPAPDVMYALWEELS